MTTGDLARRGQYTGLRAVKETIRENILRIWRVRGDQSFDAMKDLCNISKGLAHTLIRGTANPTLENLLKVKNGYGLDTFGELLDPPGAHRCPRCGCDPHAEGSSGEGS